MAINASVTVNEYRIKNKISRYKTLSFFTKFLSMKSRRFCLFKNGKLTSPNWFSFHMISD